MVKLTIAQINKELNFLEANYQGLTIKTIPYRDEKKRLLKQKSNVEKMNDKELIKLESQKKNYKKSKLSSEFKKSPTESGIEDGGRIIVGEDNDEYVSPER